jgi:hypothetical protein
VPPIEQRGHSGSDAGLQAIQDCTSHLQTHGLLRPPTARALDELFGTESPALNLSITIGRIAETHYGSEAAGKTLQRVHLLAAAAVHAATRGTLAGPSPLANGSDTPPPSPLEWLYLAQAVAALDGGHLSSPAAQPLTLALARFYPLLATPSPTLLSTDGPALSYGAGDFLAVACGASPQGAIGHAGRALGQVVRLAQEAKDLFCAKPSGEIPTAPYLLSRMARKTGAEDGMLAIGWAHASLNPADRSDLRHALMHALRDEVPRCMCDLQAAREAAPAAGAVQSWLRRIESECRGDLDRALAAAGVFALLPRKDARKHSPSELDRTISLATSALSDDLTFREAWEVQRWGDWCQAPRVGRLFPAGLCLLALAAAGHDVSEPIAALLEQSRRADGWRYFDDWTGIAPDADDLGLVLQLLPLAARQQSLRDALAWPVELLLRHTEPVGLIPTWLDKDLIEPPPASSPEWLGRQCLGVTINAALGLVQAAWPLPEGYLDRAIAFIVATYENQPERGIFYYSTPYVHLLLARLWRSLQDGRVALDACALLDALLTRIQAQILASRHADGGWRSPQTTACHLELLTLRKAHGFDPAPCLITLAGRQRYDGLWPAEPLFRCPGKDRAQESYGSRAVTTSICLHALVRARGSRHGHP